MMTLQESQDLSSFDFHYLSDEQLPICSYKVSLRAQFSSEIGNSREFCRMERDLSKRIGKVRER